MQRRALVSTPSAHPHVLVGDTTAALNALGIAARARTAAKIAGVTGSVGKTGTKEALAAALARANKGPVHRSVKSYNNHTGVPLSLARMPADTRFGVFEMGMNHAGEIRALTTQVRPHVALITTIAPAHIENLGSIEAIADARKKTIPAQRFGNPQEFGDTCAFLCSAQASYITGQNVLTDGGAYAGTY